ncbi:hypothetical protein OG21DRAFT_1527879 [Imleria badia]|nr:hypothetical protein OG21DRAFT_1527879 [Imleria badia]
MSLGAAIDSEPEAYLNGDEWDNLEVEDNNGDPLIFSEYITEIFKYMKKVELPPPQLGLDGSFKSVILSAVENITLTEIVLATKHEGAYLAASVHGADRYELKTIEQNLLFANSMHFLRRISKVDDYDVKTRTIGKYLASALDPW